MAVVPSLPSYRTLGLIVALGWLITACGNRSIQSMTVSIPVQTQTIKPGTVEDSSEFSGILEAEQRVELKPEVSGRIVQIFVTSGDRVRQGQVILQLQPEKLQAEVSSSQAAAQAADFGQQAAAAQLQSAQASWQQAQSNFQLAHRDFSRSQSLASKGALSRQELDSARNRLEVAWAAERSAQEGLRTAQAALNQAISTWHQNQSQVAIKQQDLSFRQISAPVPGQLGDMALRVGDFVSTGQPITTIIQNQALFLKLQVPTSRSTQLRLGLPIELLDPNTGKSLATGTIGFIAPNVSSMAQSILVKARFPNEANTLRDGQMVQARIIWKTTTALLVPTVAISRLGGQSFVYVASQQINDRGQPSQVASQRPVQLGDIQGDSYRVVGGLRAGEQIIITNILRLRDGVVIQTEPLSPARSPGT
ncbi:MAG: efflux RND transporter periplasmic adaptor subunit [Nodosilinea sp.]